MSHLKLNINHYHKYSDKLFDYQQEACNKIYKYFSKYASLADKNAFLVKMPTGSGKTGVIAATIFSRPKIKCALVIVPSKALRNQLTNNFKYSFWEKVGVDPKTSSKDIVNVYPSKIKKDLEKVKKDKQKKVVFISTIHSLYEIYSNGNHKASYKTIKDLIDIVIFDEGHREPSVNWKKAVRGLDKPTLLFSATPYRNDLKSFAVDDTNKDLMYWLNHDKVVKSKKIRKVNFEQVATSKNQLIDKAIVKFKSLESEFKKQGTSNPKLIIRCGNLESVKKITNKLSSNGEKVLGIHQNFKAGDITLKKNVPEDLDSYDILVHQWKLLEGIDAPECCALVIYDEFGNTRSLIQQIGRVIRTTNHTKTQEAFVLVQSNSKAESEWNDYLTSDKTEEVFSPRKLFKKYLDVLPDEPVYYEKRFRNLIYKWEGLDSDETLSKINFKQSTKVLLKGKNYNNSKVYKEIIYELSEVKDHLILKSFKRNKDQFFIYTKFHNTPFLREQLFLEFDLAFIYIKLIGDYVFYYSTDNTSIDIIQKLSTLESPKKLQALLNESKRYSSISLKNSDIGEYAIRSRTISAHDLKNLSGDLNDYAYLVSNALAYVEKGNKSQQRRYVGFSRGRVTDNNDYKFTHNQYLNWIKSLSVKINAKVQSDFLLRYAQFVDAPKNTEVRNILIDIQDIKTSIYSNQSFPESIASASLDELGLDELCLDIRSSKFKWTIGATQFSVGVKYKEGKYILESRELDSMFDFIRDGKKVDTILSVINKEQRFRIVPKSQNIIYAHGVWIKPRRAASQYLNILSIIYKTNSLFACDSEKGSAILKTNGTKWHKDTLFGKVARKGIGDAVLKGHLDNYKYFVCDDMGAEIADFIGVNMTDRKLCLVHAKNGSSSVSASSFHIVCSQALKNLGFFSPFYDKKPDKNIAKWNKKWSDKYVGDANNKHFTTKDSKAIWSDIEELLTDPNTTKELIIMAGHSLDYDKFKKKINKDNITDTAAIQLMYLLNATWSETAKFGVKLKILC